MMKRILLALATTFVSVAAFAQEAATHAASTGGMDKGLVALAAGLAIGIGAFGGALGQGRAASSALEGIARNPAASGKLFLPMIIGLALIESLVIYAFVIAFFLQGKI